MSSNSVTESRVKLSLLRRAGSSIQQAERVHRTNLLALVGWIKKLTLEDRMEKNWSIERKNALRRELQAIVKIMRLRNRGNSRDRIAEINGHTRGSFPRRWEEWFAE
ncbi:hypothetical protein GGU11DRAFT_760817 [Lentinula aff. detonsa]|uniref:Uncharacterized protein n=1 Tax=Lentinula aff. detonsa TaxID=2804958 RepID=A0AA38L1Q3_9AGAR|nr:hypothetical protein GGU10DRAFT_337273 [Lentinula aff. detonsa]KAJ3792370.1 hypothetical protein GGU11DRAFT_760817 [Lentinula aff. detonsa]